MWWAACELALLTAVSSVISIWGVSRVSAVTSEILGSTLHVFVPLLTLGLVGGSSFGMNTWLGCLLAFVAAVISCLADNTDAVASGGGGGGGKDYAGQFAVVLGTFVFGWNRVRTQVLLRGLEAEALNTARMMLMGLFSICFIVIDVVFNENGSRQTLTKLQGRAGSMGSPLPLGLPVGVRRVDAAVQGAPRHLRRQCAAVYGAPAALCRRVVEAVLVGADLEWRVGWRDADDWRDAARVHR